MTNRGALFLCAMPMSVEAQAELFGKSVRTIYNWRKGRIVPRRGEERRAVADKGGPGESLWDEQVAAETAALEAEVVEPVAGEATPEAIADEIDCMLADARTLRNQWATMGGDLEGRTRGLERVASILKTAAAMRGTLMSSRQLMASPHWRRIGDVLERALDDYPEAMQAVRTELAKLDGDPE